MSPKPEQKIDPLLYSAVEHRRLLRLRYLNKERIVEPHDYGVHNGIAKLFAYQVRGESSQKLPNWRWIVTDLISDVELNETFPGGRATKSGKHHKWDRLFIRVKPANQD
jgi:hypothetical protein